MKKLAIAIIIIAGIQLFPQIQLQNAFPNLSFAKPVDIQTPRDGSERIFVVEQAGKIKVFQNRSSASSFKVFLDITDQVTSGGELGLLGLAFHPDYKNNGYFYVNYTTESSGLQSRISRFKVSTSNPDSADESSELILIRQSQPFSNHNGGQTSFGPDGFLYIAFGDGGSFGDPNNNAQNRSTFLGKILRIDVNTTSTGKNYGIPADNPFAGNTQGYKEEIYAWGLRNPWRFSFDSVTGQLWCADVGQGDWEEINIIKKGLNYGWRCYEGTHEYNTSGCNSVYTPPVFEYNHTGGNCSVTGGFIYRGKGVPELTSKYIYADYCSNKIWALSYDSAGGTTNEQIALSNGNPVSFGVDYNNVLYLCSFDGNIYNFKPTSTGLNDIDMQPQFRLEQNFPNPFNPETKIAFSVPKSGFVSLKIFDILGNETKNLVNEIKEPGDYSAVLNSNEMPSGVYFYTLTAGQFTETKKLVIIK